MVFLTRRLLPGPVWLHFLLLGVGLFLLMRGLFPEPLPILGPPNANRLAVMADSYAQLAGSLPTPADEQRFIDLELRDELLFREALHTNLHLRDGVVEQRIIRNMRFLDPATEQTPAELLEAGLALNMHLTDEVIRRRLVQVMSQFLIASEGLPPPSDAEVAAAFAARQATFLEPARVSFRHVFLGDTSAREAAGVLQDIRDQELNPEQAIRLGKAFLSGFTFTGQSWRDVAARMGREFAEALQGVAPGIELGIWTGPVSSVYGSHLVFIEDYQPAREQRLDEVALRLRWDLQKERETAALEAALLALMAGYEVRRS